MALTEDDIQRVRKLLAKRGSSCAKARVALAVLIGVIIGAMGIKYGPHAVLMMGAAFALTCVKVDVYIQAFHYLGMGASAGIAKVLQRISEGADITRMPSIATIGVATLFGPAGGFLAENQGFSSAGCMAAAFIFGALGFGVFSLLDNFLNKKSAPHS